MTASFRPSVSSSSILTIPSSINYCRTEDKGFWYYDALDGSKVSGPTIYRDLVESAENVIDIVDPYLREQDSTLFVNISSSVNIRILTSMHQTDRRNIICNRNNFVRSMKNIQLTKGFGLKISAIDGSRHSSASKSRNFHDRYLFIDDRVFLIGSSMHYHSIEGNANLLDGIANTSVTELFGPENKKLIKEVFEQYWDSRDIHSSYCINLCDEPGIPIVLD